MENTGYSDVVIQIRNTIGYRTVECDNVPVEQYSVKRLESGDYEVNLKLKIKTPPVVNHEIRADSKHQYPISD